MIVKSPKLKVKETCDQLIAWGFCCSKPADYLVKQNNSPEYAIMCATHANGFRAAYPSESITFHNYSLELNQRFADEAKAYWEVKEGK